MNPYWGTDFFSFLSLFITRVCQFALGSKQTIASDEVQIAVLALTAIACGFIGPFLVLKKMAMFATSLSHTILLGIAAAFVIGNSLWGATITDISTLFLGALFASLLTAFLTEGFVRLFRLQEDASIGIVFTALFALGILFVTLFTRNTHLSVEAVMGNADALNVGDIKLSFALALLNGVVILLFFPKLKICSFDLNLAKSFGLRYGSYHFLLLFLAAITIIGAFRAVGVILVLSFLVGPYLTARIFVKRLSYLLILTPLIGVVVSIIGVALSRHILSVYQLPLSTGAIASSLLGIVYLIAKGGKLISSLQRSSYVILKDKR